MQPNQIIYISEDTTDGVQEDSMTVEQFQELKQAILEDNDEFVDNFPTNLSTLTAAIYEATDKGIDILKQIDQEGHVIIKTIGGETSFANFK